MGNERYLIYGLVDPRTNAVRYIGKSCSGMKRPRRHWCPWELARDKTYKAQWLRQLVADGFEPQITVIAEAITAGDLPAMERLAIAWARALDWPLTNLTDGGEGRSGREVAISEEVRKKISAALTGRKQSEATKEKRRQSLIRAGAFEKMAAAKRGKPMSDAHREAIRASMNKPEVRERVIAATRSAQARPEVRAANAERGRRQFDDPAMREAARCRAIANGFGGARRRTQANAD